ncbi:tRNA 2-selenouridine(34) synthase MnmH [Anaerosphaera multitolerans]|uniref:tRNA 2-selenouridine(34) synthase MnmH n=1 Tax=Anaerosphaera multitolerans TaxID=2487351 RepID=A0A437S9K4_9FIRM|nr:tRNA 2-selenouridine(34) synthase MnmH [Anaerosphaera multitolerans]RVU55497.1 tRNA 2-selenouridine(34) synthase MnmH [Anaerosphaera multitolerans]
MFKAIDYKETLNFKNPLYIDLRSEGEFFAFTIPNSVNMPILNDSQREEVSILYVKGEIEKSKAVGVQYALSKLNDYFNLVSNLGHERDIVLFCSRGGYRSTVLFNFLKSLDERVYKLNFGYKGYRHFIIDELPKLVKQFTFVNLNGYTGSGKTEILDELENLGAQVLNLEKLASHRGSIFGGVGLKDQPSQKMFESLLFEKLYSFKEKLVFTESESIKIGKLSLPKYLYDAYSLSPNQVLINSSIETRVRRIKEEYVHLEDGGFQREILQSLDELHKYINDKRFENYKNLIEKDEYDIVIEDLIKKYYDQNYSIKKSNFKLTMENEDSKVSAKKIFEHFNK